MRITPPSAPVSLSRSGSIREQPWCSAPSRNRSGPWSNVANGAIKATCWESNSTIPGSVKTRSCRTICWIRTNSAFDAASSRFFDACDFGLRCILLEQRTQERCLQQNRTSPRKLKVYTSIKRRSGSGMRAMPCSFWTPRGVRLWMQTRPPSDCLEPLTSGSREFLSESLSFATTRRGGFLDSRRPVYKPRRTRRNAALPMEIPPYRWRCLRCRCHIQPVAG